MLCGRCRNKLEDYLAGELDERERADVAAHLAGCAECQAAADELAPIATLAEARLPAWQPPDGFAQRVTERTATAGRSAWDLGRGRALRFRPRERMAEPGGWWLALLLLLAVLLGLPSTRQVLWRTLERRSLSTGSHQGYGVAYDLAKATRAGWRRHEAAESLRRPWAKAVTLEGQDAFFSHQIWEELLRQAPEDEFLRLRYVELLVGGLDGFGAAGSGLAEVYDESRSWHNVWEVLTETRQLVGRLRPRVGVPFSLENREAYRETFCRLRHLPDSAPGYGGTPDTWTRLARVDLAQRAAAELVRVAPDNGYAQLLAATTAFFAGDLDQCETALRAAVKAPRWDSGRSEVVARRAQVSLQKGDLPLVAWLEAQAGLLLPDLMTIRWMARGLASEAWSRHETEPRWAAETDLLLARVGTRLREDSADATEAVVGMVLQAIAFADKEPANRAPQTSAGQAEKDRHQRQQAEQFASRLRQAGMAELAPWPVAEMERNLALRQATRADGSYYDDELAPRLLRAASWYLGAAVLLGQGLLLLLLAGMTALRRRRREVTPLVWTGRQVALVVIPLALLDLAALAGTGCVTAWRQASQGEWPDAVLRPLLLIVLPAVLFLVALWWLGGGYAKRVGAPRWRLDGWIEWILEAGPFSPSPRIQFVRRSWCVLVLPLAALLLSAALLTSVPIAAELDAAGRVASQMLPRERERLDELRADPKLPPRGELPDAWR